MLEVRRGPDLGDEPIGADTGDDLGFHDFQRDQAIVPEIVREIHGGHTTRTQDAVDPVMACEGLRQGRRERAHRWRAGYTLPAAAGAERAKAVRYAEAFEICEYGTRPDEAMIRKLFPFLK